MTDWFKVDKIEVAHEDERRSISAIFNGDFTAKQVKLLRIKKHSILGNHYHSYREMFYILEGRAVYLLEHIALKEQQLVTLCKGDRLIIEPKIAHLAEMWEGTITLEATEESYISAEHNDRKYNVIIRRCKDE